jgi:hypothetical protein
MMKANAIRYGKYQHYRTQNLYEIIGLARHSETLEEMVVYKALYQCEKFGLDQIWVRPKSMFFELVFHNGSERPRFEWISE